MPWLFILHTYLKVVGVLLTITVAISLGILGAWLPAYICAGLAWWWGTLVYDGVVDKYGPL